MALPHPQASASLTISQATASISELQLGVRLGPSLCAAVTRESRISRVSQSSAARGNRHPAPGVPPAPDSWASVVPSDERWAEGHTQLSTGSHACIYLENPRASRYAGNRGLVYVLEEEVFLNTWVIAMGQVQLSTEPRADRWSAGVKQERMGPQPCFTLHLGPHCRLHSALGSKGALQLAAWTEP